MRLFYVLTFCLIIGFIIPIILDEFVYDSVAPVGQVPGTCHIVEGVRTDCMPDTRNVNETTCLERGCCFQLLDLEIGAPLCHHKLPSIHSLNATVLEDGAARDQSLVVFEPEEVVWPHGKFASPAMRVRQVEPGHVTVLFYDSANDPGMDEGSPEITDLNIILRNTSYTDDERVRLRVTRPEAPETELLDSSYGSLVLGESLSEISFVLPKTAIYGLGGHAASFGGNKTFTNKTLYNTDSRIQGEKYITFDPDMTRMKSYLSNITYLLFYIHAEKIGHLAHSFPMFLAQDDTRNYFGGYMEAQKPLTIEAYPGLIGPSEDSPLLVFRSLGGYLMLHLYTGTYKYGWI